MKTREKKEERLFIEFQETTKTHLFNVEMKNASWVEIDMEFFIFSFSFFVVVCLSLIIYRCFLFILVVNAACFYLLLALIRFY